MRRDPRLRRCGERRSPRRLHGLRLTPAFKLAQRISAVYGLSFRPAYFKRMAAAMSDHERAQARLLASLRASASVVAANLTRQLRQDFALYGEAHVAVHWDPVFGEPRHERIPPERVAAPRFRADGWPLCPTCGEDELADLGNTYARADAILYCYRCGWRGVVEP